MQLIRFYFALKVVPFHVAPILKCFFFWMANNSLLNLVLILSKRHPFSTDMNFRSKKTCWSNSIPSTSDAYYIARFSSNAVKMLCKIPRWRLDHVEHILKVNYALLIKRKSSTSSSNGIDLLLDLNLLCHLKNCVLLTHLVPKAV